MLLLQAPSFKGFFENSQVFAELVKEISEEIKMETSDITLDEMQCKMMTQLCAETIIKHNMNPAQMGRCDLKIYIDTDNSKEVRQYFSLFKNDPRKDIKARALDIRTALIQNTFCVVMSRKANIEKRKLWDELKTEFLTFATNKEKDK